MTHLARRNISRGVTLFETLIYIFIFSLLMTGALATSFWTAETSARTARLAILDSEVDFVLRKIDWASTGSTISAPSSGNNGTTLTFTRDGETYTFMRTGETLMFILNGFETPLTTNNVTVSSFSATHIAAGSGEPAAASTTIVVNGKTYGPKIRYVR